MTIKRRVIELSLLLMAFIILAGCGPNTYGISRMNAQELTTISDFDLCYSQHYWRSTNLANEINRRTLDCSAMALRRTSSIRANNSKGSKTTAMMLKNNATDIRKIDFLNYSYHSTLCNQAFGENGIGKVVRVVNGEFKNSDVYFGVVENTILYSDLTNDNTPEAIVNIGCGLFTANYGIFETFIYTMKNEQPSLLAQLNYDDIQNDYMRYYPHVSVWYVDHGGVNVAGGNLVVSLPVEGAHCCPKYIATLKYRWNGRSLVQVGKIQRKKFGGS